MLKHRRGSSLVLGKIKEILKITQIQESDKTESQNEHVFEFDKPCVDFCG